MPSWRGDTVTYNQAFVIVKADGLKLVKANKTFREQAELSRSMKSSKRQVIAADEKVMTIVLKGKQSDHLDTMQEISALPGADHDRGKRPSTPTCCNQRVQQRSTTSSESSSRSNSGRGILCRLEIGVESCVEED